LYRDLEYAKTLIRHRASVTAASSTSTSIVPDPSTHLDEDGNIEESWTFIGDDSDPELVRRIAEWYPETVVKRESSMKRESSISRTSKRLSVRGREREKVAC
jgi:sterol 3beta-glucosyltransferase